MKKFFPFFILLFLPDFISGQSDDSSFFINLMKTEFEAFQKKDPSVWLENVDDNAIFTDAENVQKTKEQIVEEMKNAPDIFLSGTETYENIITKTFGNTGVVSCITTFSFTSADGNLNRIKFKFTRVHVKEGSQWKLVYHSAIPIEG